MINSTRGVEKAREWSRRTLVEEMDVVYFSLFFSYLTNKVPDRVSVANTCIFQDIIERQNRLADDAGLHSKTGIWEIGCFEEEFAGALVRLGGHLISKYGRVDGHARLSRIVECLENWFTTNRDSSLKIDSGELIDPRIYRETDDRSWLRTVMMIFTDGDEKMVEKNLKTVFAATLLLQLADDFANTFRHQRTGKLAFFARGESKIDQNDGWKRKLNILDLESRRYFNDLEINQIMKLVVRFIWFSRCIGTHVAAVRRNDDKYGDDELLTFGNQFEENLNKVWYQGRG